MRKTLYILIVIAGKLFAQTNFVPNYSFEDTIHCPYTTEQINYSANWRGLYPGTPDYYNACSTTMHVPNYCPLLSCYQNARTGNAFVAIITFQKLGLNIREYIQAKLSTSLSSGKKYVVSFYVNRADFAEYSCNSMGAYISVDPIDSISGLNPYIPQITNNEANNPLADSLNWTLISDIFTANGGEKYITIGNFKNDANSDTVYHGIFSGGTTAYYFIDDVSVIPYDSTTSNLIIPNIFSPNNDGINDEFKITGKNIASINCKIYNRWGILVAEITKTNEVWDGRTTSGLQAADGVYFYVLNAIGEDNKEYCQKGCIALLR